MPRGEGQSRGSDSRHDDAIVKHGKMAVEGDSAESRRIGGRVVRHLVDKSNRDHPPTGGKKGK